MPKISLTGLGSRRGFFLCGFALILTPKDFLRAQKTSHMVAERPVVKSSAGVPDSNQTMFGWKEWFKAYPLDSSWCAQKRARV